MLNLKALFFTSQAVGRYCIKTRRFAPEHNRGKGKIIHHWRVSRENLDRLLTLMSSSSFVMRPR